MSGRLEIIVGPMFAGKSTKLIEAARKYKTLGKQILAINHANDTRYGTGDICSHNYVVLENCWSQKDLLGLLDGDCEEFHSADVVLIDELQFYPDAYDFVLAAVNDYGKTVVAAGLSGDFRLEPIGDVLRLIPHADHVSFLSALCIRCGDGTEAHFSKKIAGDCSGSAVDVGAAEKYEAVCRKHYYAGSEK